MTDRKKPGVSFWATVVVVVVLVGYPLSFGVTHWIDGHHWLQPFCYTAKRTVFRPIIWLYENGPQPVSDAIMWYADLWYGGDESSNADKQNEGD